MRDEPAQEGEVGVDAYDLGLLERGGEQLERLAAIAALGDDLGDHRVVRDPDLVPFLDSRVDAHPGAK